METIMPAGNRLTERPVGPDFFGAVARADLLVGSAGQTMIQAAAVRHRRKEGSDNRRDFSLAGDNAFVAATMREIIEGRLRLR